MAPSRMRKREASLTSDILARIDSASQKLGQAQKDTEEYLDGVSEVLTSAHDEFQVLEALSMQTKIFTKACRQRQDCCAMRLKIWRPQ